MRKKTRPEMEEWISSEIQESIAVKSELCAYSQSTIARIAEVLVERLREGKKLLIFGNGGSAADAQHIAAELVGRYVAERLPLPAIALTTDTSVLSALGNDYGFSEIFARQIAALGAPGDVALAISTSGNSENVLRGLAAARRKDMFTIGLSGRTGGRLKNLTELCLCVPSDSTPRIQETHILIGHLLSAIVEEAFVSERAPNRAAPVSAVTLR